MQQSNFITKCGRLLLQKVRKVLQNVTVYYKVRHNTSREVIVRNYDTFTLKTTHFIAQVGKYTLHKSTTIHKIFEANSTFRVK